MKYIVLVLALLALVFFSFSEVNSQVLESDYVRQSELEDDGEVLGILGESEEQEEDEQEIDKNRIIEILAIFGGIVLVVLFAYMVFEKKEKVTI